jgi:AcrR family transcriptional regulator
MSARPAPASPRQSADVRREAIVEAAVAEFALGGLHGTSTEAIARRAGISQPYVFRLFRTKRDLFLAAMDRVCDRVVATFTEAARGAPAGERLSAMGNAYVELLGNREELLAQMQGYAACGDDEIRDAIRANFERIFNAVERLSGATPDEVRLFFAHGMLLNVWAALDIPGIAAEQAWAARFFGDAGPACEDGA